MTDIARPAPQRSSTHQSRAPVHSCRETKRLLRVVKQNDCIIGELRPPGREIVQDILVPVAAVNVQPEPVDRFLGEIAERLIESRTKQGQKAEYFLQLRRAAE